MIQNITGGKEHFINVYENLILKKYGNEWARDKEVLEKFMAAVRITIFTLSNVWNIDSPLVLKAWKEIGMSGKPTYKKLRNLP